MTALGLGSTGVPRLVVVEAHPGRSERLLAALGRGVESLATLGDLARRGLPEHEPAVIVCGPGVDHGEALGVVEWVRGAGRRDIAVVTTGSGSVGVLRDALASGIADHVDADARDDVLRHAVRRAGLSAALAHTSAGTVVGMPPAPQGLAPVGGRDEAMSAPAMTDAIDGGVVAVYAPKGGAGASTVAVNLAAALADGVGHHVEAGIPHVALVDADLQFGDQALLLGVRPDRTMVGSGDLRAGDRGSLVDANLVARMLLASPDRSVGLLAAPSDPAAADAVDPAFVLEAVDVLTALCPWVVLDLPPHLDELAVGLLDRAQRIVVVTRPALASVKAAHIALETFGRLGVADRSLVVVCNGVGDDDVLAVAEVEHHVGRRVAAVVPLDPGVEASVLDGRPVVVASPSNPAARSLASLAASLRGDATASLGVAPVSPLRRMVGWLAPSAGVRVGGP